MRRRGGMRERAIGECADDARNGESLSRASRLTLRMLKSGICAEKAGGWKWMEYEVSGEENFWR